MQVRSLARGSLSVAIAAAALTWGSMAQAQEDAPAYRETQLGLYVTAQEAYELMQEESDAVLIDVRDPIEIKFTGFAEPTDIHVPWVLADRTKFDDEAQTWPIARNPDFEEQIRAELEALGVEADTPIIMMCRSGATRSAPAVDVVAEMGYSEVYSVSDGFEGGQLAEGDSAGVRARNGWRNAGLPWGYTIDLDVAWYEGKYED
ncbi:rhodanese-like domain-containing protein [Halomonas vilamensis]|uniref:Rhodanese-like domain-containing protein n=1 Tax=Vreelandella vilamensis TaxID=531309 RepID=A0ABU1H626_9GAMM|nr:rhodanese-like domain-containing protein [Halomonas vilamensis]MDR5899560.1 rhodanese-like domain-containing protein [Halomonas vilamensis]